MSDCCIADIKNNIKKDKYGIRIKCKKHGTTIYLDFKTIDYI